MGGATDRFCVVKLEGRPTKRMNTERVNNRSENKATSTKNKYETKQYCYYYDNNNNKKKTHPTRLAAGEQSESANPFGRVCRDDLFSGRKTRIMRSKINKYNGRNTYTTFSHCK